MGKKLFESVCQSAKIIYFRLKSFLETKIVKLKRSHFQNVENWNFKIEKISNIQWERNTEKRIKQPTKNEKGNFNKFLWTFLYGQYIIFEYQHL